MSFVAAQGAPPKANLDPYNETIGREDRSQKRLIFKDTFAETGRDIPDRDDRIVGRGFVAGSNGCGRASMGCVRAKFCGGPGVTGFDE